MAEEAKARAIMRITSIEINRGYSDTAPFKAKIQVKGGYGNELSINVNEERTLQIIDIVSDLLVEAMNFEMETLRATAQQALEEKRQKELPPPVEAAAVVDDEDIPF